MIQRDLVQENTFPGFPELGVTMSVPSRLHSWRCLAIILESSLNYPGDVSQLSWRGLAIILESSGNYLGKFSRLSWRGRTIILESSGNHLGKFSQLECSRNYLGEVSQPTETSYQKNSVLATMAMMRIKSNQGRNDTYDQHHHWDDHYDYNVEGRVVK